MPPPEFPTTHDQLPIFHHFPRRALLHEPRASNSRAVPVIAIQSFLPFFLALLAVGLYFSLRSKSFTGNFPVTLLPAFSIVKRLCIAYFFELFLQCLLETPTLDSESTDNCMTCQATGCYASASPLPRQQALCPCEILLGANRCTAQRRCSCVAHRGVGA